MNCDGQSVIPTTKELDQFIGKTIAILCHFHRKCKMRVVKLCLLQMCRDWSHSLFVAVICFAD